MSLAGELGSLELAARLGVPAHKQNPSTMPRMAGLNFPRSLSDLVACSGFTGMIETGRSNRFLRWDRQLSGLWLGSLRQLFKQLAHGLLLSRQDQVRCDLTQWVQHKPTF